MRTFHIVTTDGAGYIVQAAEKGQGCTLLRKKSHTTVRKVVEIRPVKKSRVWGQVRESRASVEEMQQIEIPSWKEIINGAAHRLMDWVETL